MPRDDAGRFAPADADTFMKMWVDKGPIVVIETDNGSEVIPCSACGVPRDAESGVTYALDDDSVFLNPTIQEFVRSCLDYLEGSNPSELTYYASVWYGRFSAPGYMDATSWSWSKNRRALEKELREMYGDQ